MNIDFAFQKGLEGLEWMSSKNGRFTHLSIESCQDEAVLASDTRMEAEKALEYEGIGATRSFILKGQNRRSLRAVREACCDS